MKGDRAGEVVGPRQEASAFRHQDESMGGKGKEGKGKRQKGAKKGKGKIWGKDVRDREDVREA